MAHLPGFKSSFYTYGVELEQNFNKNIPFGFSKLILVSFILFCVYEVSCGSFTSIYVVNNLEMLGPVVYRKVVLVHQKVITYNMKVFFCTPSLVSLGEFENMSKLRWFSNISCHKYIFRDFS